MASSSSSPSSSPSWASGCWPSSDSWSTAAGRRTNASVSTDPRTVRCFTECVCQSVSDTTEELKHTTRGREGELNGFDAQSQENERRHSCDIYIFCCCYGRSICFNRIFMLTFCSSQPEAQQRRSAASALTKTL